eukprot:5142327-Ditylum_brightwellii.AAC.1
MNDIQQRFCLSSAATERDQQQKAQPWQATYPHPPRNMNPSESPMEYLATMRSSVWIHLE